jgi:hypothetical protein
MNLQNILNEIEQVDPEFYDRTDSRRHILKNVGNLGSKIALTALPFVFGSTLNKAYGQTNADIIGVLNFALTLEYLEYNFYIKAVSSSAATSTAGTAGLAALTTIRDHEGQHVNFLRSAITSAGGTPVTFTAAQFDFTAKGTFPNVFTDYDLLLAVAQTFEDTGVRAYKGQAGNVKSNRGILTAALQIHSVEARHAAHIRYMRAARGASVKPWITLNQSGINSTAVQASYNGEEVVTQAGVTITGIGGQGISANAASEAFDEPLTKDQVTAIVTPFFA